MAAIRAIILAYFMGVVVGIGLFAWMYNKELRRLSGKRRHFIP